jgi:Secretion system C-terminal sorting domain
MSWEGIPLTISGVNGKIPALFRLNKDTGVGIGVHQLYPDVGGESQVSSGIAAGPNGSYYVGGSFQSTISASASGSPVYLNTGGYDDFFIAKFGTNNCTLALVNEAPKQSLQSYPNPVASLLYVNNKETITYVIYDALGKMIQMNVLEPNGNIDLQYLDKGIYMLQMKDEDGNVTTEKIMKE